MQNSLGMSNVTLAAWPKSQGEIEGYPSYIITCSSFSGIDRHYQVSPYNGKVQQIGFQHIKQLQYQLSIKAHGPLVSFSQLRTVFICLDVFPGTLMIHRQILSLDESFGGSCNSNIKLIHSSCYPKFGFERADLTIKPLPLNTPFWLKLYTLEYTDSMENIPLNTLFLWKHTFETPDRSI